MTSDSSRPAAPIPATPDAPPASPGGQPPRGGAQPTPGSGEEPAGPDARTGGAAPARTRARVITPPKGTSPKGTPTKGTPTKRSPAKPVSPKLTPPNLFARLLGEAGVSDTRFARGVNDRARRVRRAELGLARTTVGHWRQGMRPRDPMVAEVAAAELTAVVGYPVTPSDLGWRGEGQGGDDLGLALAEEPRQTLLTVAGLSGRDMRRRHALQDNAAFVATAFAEPVLASLTGVVTSATGGTGGTMNATMIRDMTETFRRLDARYGSGEIRGQVVAFLHDRVRAVQDSGGGPDLFSALAELTQFGGWLAQDAGRQALAQRYYIQALGLAEHARDALIAGRILAAMSDQSARLGQLRSSVALARAAIERVQDQPAPRVAAMVHDKHAWALARIGDAARCEQALEKVEEAVGADGDAESPSWATHYNAGDAAECRGHCMLLLHRHEASEQSLLASRLIQSPERARTRSYAEADLALGYLRRPRPQVEAALEAAWRSRDVAGGLRSRRVSEKLAELDGVFGAFAAVSGVRDWRESYARQVRDAT